MPSIRSVLKAIDGKSYKLYRRLLRASESSHGVLVRLVRVQGDPYAPPSVARLDLSLESPPWSGADDVPVADLLCRKLYLELRKRSSRIGEGRSGLLSVPRPGPVMLRRSCLEVRGGRVTARVWVGLPSRGRRISADEAERLLLYELPYALRRAVDSIGKTELEQYVRAWRMQEYIRARLPSMGLVAFVGDGSILPRRCGGCWEPKENAVPFESPPSLRVEVELPWGEAVAGMGVRKGLTVIVGSAFHGKTTLAEAISQGVWNHIPGDGREKVVTVRDAVVVRAEDGRRISCVDISPMIHDLPDRSRTDCFSTTSASGATSTAASIQEAIETGSRLLVLDEDSVATNILYSDERVAGVTRWRTVTPLPELASAIRNSGVSIIVVSSGSLQLFSAADTVLLMEAYRTYDITGEARSLAARHGLKPGSAGYRLPPARVVEKIPELRKPKIRGLLLEDERLDAPVDLRPNYQLVESSQLNTLQLVARRLQAARGRRLAEHARSVEKDCMSGFKLLAGPEPGPELAEVRAQDVAFLLNRLPIEASLSDSQS